MRLSKHIEEAFNKKIKIERMAAHKASGSFLYSFEVNGHRYFVATQDITASPYPKVYKHFKLEGKTGPEYIEFGLASMDTGNERTNRFDHVEVFSGVKRCVEKYLKEDSAGNKGILFSSYPENERAYMRFVKVLCKKTDYELVDTYRDNNMFTIFVEKRP